MNLLVKLVKYTILSSNNNAKYIFITQTCSLGLRFLPIIYSLQNSLQLIPLSFESNALHNLNNLLQTLTNNSPYVLFYVCLLVEAIQKYNSQILASFSILMIIIHRYPLTFPPHLLYTRYILINTATPFYYRNHSNNYCFERKSGVE